MNLLPKSTKEFSSKQYWDAFFQKRKNSFEWYGEYSELCGLLHKYCKPNDQILQAGCGNSRLSEDLYDVGYRSLINIDISDVVIKQMISRNQVKRSQMKFLKMDLLDLQFKDETFHVVLDKGTLDAIFTSSEEKISETVEKVLKEITRVLRLGGRYICISLAQKHILDKLLDFFPNLNWFTRVHKIDTPSNVSSLPVFAFVFTKTRPVNSGLVMPTLLEIVSDPSEKVIRLKSVAELSEFIISLQEFALVKKDLQTLNLNENFLVDLWSSVCCNHPRFSLTIVDTETTKAGKFAIFIVPQGREHEWMFSVKEGQKQLAESAGFQRLVIVSLSRAHSYESMEKIKEELSSKVMEFAQNGVNSSSQQIPFLSIGDDAGCRKLVYEGTSSYTSDYVIEDVTMEDGEIFRHLIFLQNKNVVQSEARLCERNGVKSRKKKIKDKAILNVDISYLSFQHHQAIIAALSLSSKLLSDDTHLLMIGLGGGSLPMFIHFHFPHIYTTVVELDPDIVKVAKDWFEFQESERMELIIGDGLDVITEGSTKYDVIIFDIDSKDMTKGLSSPPGRFVEKKILTKVKETLNADGLFILNLVCRDEERKFDVINSIHEIFPNIYRIDIENEVNEILICSYFKSTVQLSKIKNDGQKLKEQILAVTPSRNVDLISFLDNLKII